MTAASAALGDHAAQGTCAGRAHAPRRHSSRTPPSRRGRPGRPARPARPARAATVWCWRWSGPPAGRTAGSPATTPVVAIDAPQTASTSGGVAEESPPRPSTTVAGGGGGRGGHADPPLPLVTVRVGDVSPVEHEHAADADAARGRVRGQTRRARGGSRQGLAWAHRRESVEPVNLGMPTTHQVVAARGVTGAASHSAAVGSARVGRARDRSGRRGSPGR